MKYVIVFSLILLSFQSAYGYTDKQHGFSIAFPKGWYITKPELSSGNSYTVAIDPRTDAKLAILVGNGTIRTQQFKDPEFVRFTAKQNLRVARTLCPEPKFADVSTTHFGKYQALNMLYTCMDNSIVAVYIIPTQTNGYVFTFSGPKEVAGSSQIEKAITSFKVLK